MNKGDELEEDFFDTKWIEDYEKNETYYSMFYPEVNKTLNVNILYVNKNRELEKIKEEKINLMHENMITKSEWIRLVKNNETIDKQKYNLISILIYNFELQHEELKNFFKYANKNKENIIHTDINDYDSKYNYMKKLKVIDDYKLSSTINCLQSVNNIFILFAYKEKREKQDIQVKKISTIENTNNDNNDEKTSSIMKKSNSHGTTKRVRFNLLTPSKKTRRKKPLY